MSTPAGALERDEAATAGDALPRVVGAVLHHLFRRDVERHAFMRLRPPALYHGCNCSAKARGLPDLRLALHGLILASSFGPSRSAGCAARRRRRSSARKPVGVDRPRPSGKMPRTRSGPPVAMSSSAAANSGADRERDRVVERQAFAPAGLDPVAGVDAARTLGLEVELFVAAAGDVVGEHPARSRGAGRSRRRAARRRGPASRRAGCRARAWPSWLALPSRLSISPCTFS